MKWQYILKLFGNLQKDCWKICWAEHTSSQETTGRTNWNVKHGLNSPLKFVISIPVPLFNRPKEPNVNENRNRHNKTWLYWRTLTKWEKGELFTCCCGCCLLIHPPRAGNQVQQAALFSKLVVYLTPVKLSLFALCRLDNDHLAITFHVKSNLSLHECIFLLFTCILEIQSAWVTVSFFCFFQ